MDNDDEKAACTYIVRTHLTDDDKYRFGNTQIFFRAGQVTNKNYFTFLEDWQKRKNNNYFTFQVAYLEQIRSDVRRAHIIRVQSLVRRFVCRKRFLLQKQLALGLQRYGRGYLARKKAEAVRQNRAAIIIQSYIRGWLCRQRYHRIMRSILLIQTHGRAIIARRSYTIKLENFKATEVQRYCRGFLARKAFEHRRRQIVLCQSTIRRFLARRLFKKLKAEARTITHMQKMYKGLENKIISLQQKIDELNKYNGNLRQQTDEIPELKTQLNRMKAIQGEVKALNALILEKEYVIESITKELEAERDEKMSILDQKSSEEQKWKVDKENITMEREKLQEKVNELIERDKNEKHGLNL